MNVLLLEDRRVDELHPVTLGRPAYAISCASFRLVDWLLRLSANIVPVVRPHLEKTQRLDFPQFATDLDPDCLWTLVLNARTVPSFANFKRISSAINRMGSETGSQSSWFVRDAHGEIAAAMVPTASLLERKQAMDDAGCSALTIDGLQAAGIQETIEPGVDTLGHLHDIIRCNQQHMIDNLEFRIRDAAWDQRRDGLFVAPGAVVCDSVVVDTGPGPVIVDREAAIQPFSFLQGPLYIGPNCTVNAHAAIKDGVCLAGRVKVGGEIEATIIEPYSNKQHDGFLGHSYLGSWINVGAGTCNSDLKNTYGQVNMVRQGRKIGTGMQFIGCFMGDYSKTAINTSIFTGKTIGVGSMLYGFVTENVPSFVNYAKTFGQLTEIPSDIMQITQKRMFERRQVVQRGADIELMQAMFELTRSERISLSTTPPEL